MRRRRETTGWEQLVWFGHTENSTAEDAAFTYGGGEDVATAKHTRTRVSKASWRTWTDVGARRQRAGGLAKQLLHAKQGHSKCSKQNSCNSRMQHIKDSNFPHFFFPFFVIFRQEASTKRQRVFDGRDKKDGNSSSRTERASRQITSRERTNVSQNPKGKQHKQRDYHGYYLTRISETRPSSDFQSRRRLGISSICRRIKCDKLCVVVVLSSSSSLCRLAPVWGIYMPAGLVHVDSPVCALYQYLVPSSVACSDHAGGVGAGAP